MAAEGEIVSAVSAVGGASLMALVGRYAIQAWIRRQDRLAVTVENLQLQVTRIEERIASLAMTEARTHKQDIELGVIKSELATIQKDLNGIGRKLGAINEKKGA